MTVIRERRFDTDFIFLFVAGVVLAAALRTNAHMVSVVCFAIAAAVLGVWIYMGGSRRLR